MHEPLVLRQDVDTVGTDGWVSDRLVVTTATPTSEWGERVWLPLPGCRQSIFSQFYRAERLAVVRALEECSPRRVVSDCKGVSCLCSLCDTEERPESSQSSPNAAGCLGWPRHDGGIAR
eukprot:905133-Amphidinium_carterae.2